MRKALKLLFILTVMAVYLTGCGQSTKSDIVGKWMLEEKTLNFNFASNNFQLNKDGTGVVDNSTEITWKIKDNNLILHIVWYDKTFTFEMEDDTLTLYDNDYMGRYTRNEALTEEVEIIDIENKEDGVNDSEDSSETNTDNTNTDNLDSGTTDIKALDSNAIDSYIVDSIPTDPAVILGEWEHRSNTLNYPGPWDFSLFPDSKSDYNNADWKMNEKGELSLETTDSREIYLCKTNGTILILQLGEEAAMYSRKDSDFSTKYYKMFRETYEYEWEEEAEEENLEPPLKGDSHHVKGYALSPYEADMVQIFDHYAVIYDTEKIHDIFQVLDFYAGITDKVGDFVCDNGINGWNFYTILDDSIVCDETSLSMVLEIEDIDDRYLEVKYNGENNEFELQFITDYVKTQ